jgi:hypothetical protein
MFLAGESSDEEQNGVAGLLLALDRGWPKATADVEPITAAKVAGQLAAPFPATAGGELFGVVSPNRRKFRQAGFRPAKPLASGNFPVFDGWRGAIR